MERERTRGVHYFVQNLWVPRSFIQKFFAIQIVEDRREDEEHIYEIYD